MKKRNILKFLSLVLCVTAITMGINVKSVVAQDKTETQPVYKTVNGYAYKAAKAFESSPDSFEAWVNIPQNSIGGTIAGNYYNNLIGYPGCVNWEVDPVGRIKLFWNNGAFTHTFKGAHIADGKWHHVAVVRNAENNTFSLYIDAEFIESVYSRQRDAITTMPLSIGVDYKNWTVSKEPLDGKVKQVTVYTGAIDEDKIAKDMQTENVSEGTANATLLGNWYLGENWTSRNVKDTSSNANDATLYTFEKYLGVVDTGAYDYTIVTIPDIQSMVNYRPARLTNLANWLVNNKQKYNMQFAMQLGDLSDSGTVEKFYATAAEGMSILDGKLPYTFVPGNHDYDDNSKTRATTYYNKYFPYSKYSQYDYFGGAYEEGKMDNTYSLFEVGDVKYMVICLEFGPRMEVIRWAGRLCEKYPDRRVIVTTHAYIDPDGTIMDGDARYSATTYFAASEGATTGQQLYDGLIARYPNIFMAINGHNPTDDIVMRTDVGVNGNKIISYLVDPQCTKINGGAIGEDCIVLMKFNEKNKTIAFSLYSPEYDKVLNIQNQFIVSFAE